MLASTLGVVASFAGASLAFLWPSLKGGFGAQLEVGSESAVADEIAANGHLAFPAGRAYLVGYDAALDPDGNYAEITNGTPFMALYHRCVHLGCRVPWCASSSWFECPCHGSRYNVWGSTSSAPPRGGWIALRCPSRTGGLSSTRPRSSPAPRGRAARSTSRPQAPTAPERETTSHADAETPLE